MTLDLAQDIQAAPIRLHAPADFEGMRRAGRLAAECLDLLVPLVVPGALTDDLDRVAREFVLDHGAIPACLGYKGYTKTVCISPNHVVCHGVPGSRANLRLSEGDVANIDVTVIVDGWHGDTSRMYTVGGVSPKARRLLETTHAAMMAGIEAIRPGATFADIGHAIQTLAEGQRCAVVRDFCGHGVGRIFHDAPNVLHYVQHQVDRATKRPIRGPDGQPIRAATATLKPGMFFTVEPMINLGRADTKTLNDGWTAVTKDKSLSAQYEHSVGVTETGFEIFTLSPTGLDRPGL